MRLLVQDKPMTYATLERTLKPLGFTKRVVDREKAIVFDHNTTDASVILPLRDATAPVSPLDLLTVRKTVVEKGVATAARYQALARRARLVRPRPRMNTPKIKA